MRENATKHRQDRRIAVYLIAILVCIFLGPFGTANELGFWDRLIFWTVSISAVGFFMEICMRAALRAPYLQSLPMFGRMAIGAVLGGLPGTAVIIFVNLVFRPDHLTSSVFPVLWMQVSMMAMIIGSVDVITGSKNVSQLLAKDDAAGVPEMPAAAEELASPPPEPNPLLARLDPSLRTSAIISLSMQDHYVEVTTTAGAEMILMRLADAMDMLGPLPGAQTHRSHWAAQAHSTAIRRDGRRHFLTLSDGREIPVSKSYLQDVAAMVMQKGQT